MVLTHFLAVIQHVYQSRIFPFDIKDSKNSSMLFYPNTKNIKQYLMQLNIFTSSIR